jgi:DNA polymerase-3 subunit epsilon
MQRSFDDLGTPLHDVTFCVVDLETTGGSPIDCGITEVGAVKLRGGQCLGTFQTLVNPDALIPPAITYLTGITQAMVMPAPRIAEVLPAFLEFAHGTVLVGHNFRFDLAFLNAALMRHEWPRLTHRCVDTCALARRLVRDEVPNCRLGTLASRLRLDHVPSHRALDDALATGDLLHVMLERAGRLGVTGLDDLLALPKMASHPQVRKLRLTDRLPRSPGVYLFRDGGGRAIYVGKATNLRTRVRSYFSSDDRRSIGPMLREAQSIDHIPCASALEAGVIEVRLIHELSPRYNRQVKRWRSYSYVKLTAERFPRLSVARVAKDDGSVYLGPLSSARVAKLVIEAIETAVPIRRCTGRPGAILRAAPCAPAQLGVSTCPCSGAISEDDYADITQRIVRGMTSEPSLLLDPLTVRMEALARAERYEEAADMRNRADALAGALRRQRRFDGLRAAGRIVLEVPGQHGAELTGGRLVRAWAGVDDQAALPFDRDDDADLRGPVPRDLADELTCVAGWLDANAGKVRIVHCDEGLRSALPALPSFAAR